MSPPYGFLIFGGFLLLLAVGGTCTGEAWARFGQVVYRDKEPKDFWTLIAILSRRCLLDRILLVQGLRLAK
jgi:hypothetical protein